MDRIWPALFARRNLFARRKLVAHHTNAPAGDTPCRHISRGCMRVWYHGHKTNVKSIMELLCGNTSLELYRRPLP